MKEEEGVLSLSFLSRLPGVVGREMEMGASEGEYILQTLFRSLKLTGVFKLSPETENHENFPGLIHVEMQTYISRTATAKG